MKIEKNYDNMMDAWMLAANAMDTIKHTFLENGEPEAKEIDAFYELLHAINRWNSEIKKMPF